MAEESSFSRQTLTQRVYGWLRQQILTGELNQGDRLTELTIASELGVSPTPVREAVRLLVGDGLVVSDGWKGSKVVELTEEEIRQCFEVRRSLEVLALHEAMKRLGPEECDELVRVARATAGGAEGPAGALFELDRRFHGFLVEKAGNRWLSAFLGNLSDVLTVARLPLFRAAKVVQTTREHVAIAEAIRHGDVREAERLLNAHIDRVLENSVVAQSEVAAAPSRSGARGRSLAKGRNQV